MPPPQRTLSPRSASPWLWLAPALIPFAVMLLWPVLHVAFLSFHAWDWNDSQFVGLAQYRRLFRDPEFWRALAHTLLFAAVVVPAWIVATLLIAAAIAPQLDRARGFWMTAFYITYLVSPVILAIVWTWILAPGQLGLANRALAALGLDPVPWLTTGRWALASVIFSTAVTIPGSGVVIYTAALRGLPEELFEAARIEGAGPLARLWHVAVPLLRPTTLYLAVIYTIASFQVFERVYIMTGGGPGGATSVIVEQIFSRAFLDFDFGPAAAESIILLILVALIASAQFHTMRGEIEY